jgi:large subunit ribosomal protein L9
MRLKTREKLLDATLDKVTALSIFAPPSPAKTHSAEPSVSALRVALWHHLTIRPAVIMPNVDVILKEQIKGLGAEADIVKVRAGFARNFLVPQGKALEATKGNLAHVKGLKFRRAERESKELAEAEATAAKLKRLNIKLVLQTGSGGKAFGAITAQDIIAALQEHGNFGLDKHAVQLDRPIKSTGKFDVAVKVHPQLTTNVKISVVASGAESAESDAASE